MEKDYFIDLNENIKALRLKAARLPAEPGVYIMKNAAKTIIYIGKAKALKNRVNQYFHGYAELSPKTIRLVGDIVSFDYILTSSEYEAFMLESKLIKQYKPKYNIMLKDGGGRCFIKVTAPPWSRFELSYTNISDDKSEFIGPFYSSARTRALIDEVSQIYRLPVCSKNLDTEVSRGSSCLYYSIKRCYGPCRMRIKDPAFHQKLIDEAKRFIKEGGPETVKQLTLRMEEAAEKLEFEEAARLRDRINAINQAKSRQNVDNISIKEADIFALSHGRTQSCVAVIFIRDNAFFAKEHFFIDEGAYGDDDAGRIISGFINSFYALRGDLPERILSGTESEDLPFLEAMFSEQKKKKVRVYVPARGEGLKLVEMARKNAVEQLTMQLDKSRESGMLEELERLVGIAPLHRIEAYDISNTSGADNIAGMVVFEDGKPLNSHYRQFLMRSFEGQDDYASMREAVTRRFRRFQDEAGRDASFKAKPDLILADGGVGQVRAVCDALLALGITDIAVLGMVKDSKHTTKLLVDRDGREIEIKSARGAFTMVSTIQNEAHRYVITCHRKRRSRRTTASVLINIPGIGPKRIEALMKKYKTIEAIAAASVEDLAATDGMSIQAAERTKQFFELEY